jgi:hypothetical protein
MDDRIDRLRREVRRVKRYAAGVTLLIVVLLLAAFQRAGRTHFKELDVERLNIVEKNGTVRLAIANSDRKPPITFYGKEYTGLRGGSSRGSAGMLYFNEEGTEAGGFSWRGSKTDTGHNAAGTLTFDQYNQGEALALWYADESGRRQAALVVYDQPNVSMQPGLDSLMVIRSLPDGPEKERRMEALRKLGRQSGERYAMRLFAGRSFDKSAAVWLGDPKGRPRLKLSVDSLGTPKLEFFDEDGKVTHTVPRGMR